MVEENFQNFLLQISFRFCGALLRQRTVSIIKFHLQGGKLHTKDKSKSSWD